MNLRTMVKESGKNLAKATSGQPVDEARSNARRGLAKAQVGATRGLSKAQVGATRARFKAQSAAMRANFKARTAARKAAERGNQASGSKKAVGIAGIAGAAGAFFLDPHEGARRRNVARDRIAGMARRGAERMRRRVDYGESTVEEGKFEAVNSETRPEGPDGEALSEQV